MSKVLNILGEPIPYSHEEYSIHDLRFLRGNPRVYEEIHGTPGFSEMSVEEQQDVIYRKLIKKPSVTELLPELKRHGGIMEPLVVEHRTMEVVEGNSRLAACRKLDKDGAEGDWGRVPCLVVTKFTADQRAAYLAQVHVKGKRQWSAYEKANFAYVRKQEGATLDDVASVFVVSPSTARTWIKVIQAMKDNDDQEPTNYSYYNVMVRTPVIANAEDAVRDVLRARIKAEQKEFKARELRDKLPAVLQKPKVKGKFLRGDIDLDEAYQRARRSKTDDKVRRAAGILDDIVRTEIEGLEQNEFNAVRYRVKKLSRVVRRLRELVEGIEQQRRSKT